jgi:hypothetical protein
MKKLCAGFLSPQPLDDPRARRMLRDIEMHDTPTMVADDENALEHAETKCDRLNLARTDIV